MSDHRWVLAFHLVFDFPHLHWIFSRHAARHPDRGALLPLPDCRGISGTANSVYEIYPGRVICHPRPDLDRFEKPFDPDFFSGRLSDPAHQHGQRLKKHRLETFGNGAGFSRSFP